MFEKELIKTYKSVMNTLPLWRRCRILANRLRLDMLEQLSETAALCVKEVADKLNITEDVASKNLNVLASGGFITRRQAGKYLYYSVERADTLLLEVMKLVYGNEQDRVVFTATALTHERRVAIISVLGAGSLRVDTLGINTNISQISLRRHMDKLERRGFIKVRNGNCSLTMPDNGLGEKLVQLTLKNFTLAQV